MKLVNGVIIAEKALAQSVYFHNNYLICHLKDDRLICVPIYWYPKLQNATSKQRDNWQIIAGGKGIHWPDLDEDLSVKGFLAGAKH